MSKLLPPREKKPKKEPTTSTASFRLPMDLLEWLDETATARGYSRNEAVIHCLRWCQEELEREAAERKRSK